MKRNNLTTALIAGIAGVAGIASVSTAVNLNDDGVGQVLIYPYYTVNNGINTLISVVNTTEDVKAVKVRFLEGKNSRECLDFNLYLSPYDVWTAGLVAQTSTDAGAVASGFGGQNSVKLVTSDTSCTVPAINGQEFLPYAFSGDFDDGLVQDMDRCTEGHFEMIEMGTVLGADATAATHVAGVPANCGAINANWTPGTGQWSVDSTVNMQAPDGSGGLFGSTTLVDVPNGVAMTYNADAIQAFTTSLTHSDPGSLLPNVGSGSEDTSNIFYNGVVVSSQWTGSNIQAVSALYMHDNIYGEYVLTDAIGANTEWVVTFPTKFAYVDAANSPFGVIPHEPFTVALTDTIGACEPYAVSGLYDREEQVPLVDPATIVPSPVPPGVAPNIPVFCWETNVLEFNSIGDDLGNSAILGSKNTTHLTSEFNEGWVSVSFNRVGQSTAENVLGTTYTGLPVTGFAAQKYVNGSLNGGATLANYAGLFSHRYSKNIR